MGNVSDSERRRLHMKAISRNLSELSLEDQKKLVDGLQGVPIKQLYDQAQYIENILLPKILASRGVESEDYKFYKGVANSLIWAMFIVDRFEFLKSQYTTEQLFREFLQEQLIVYKSELDKYQTVEDMFMNLTYDKYSKAVGKRIENELKRK